MVVVLEPRMKSVDTIRRIMKLSQEIEVKEVLAVGNKVARPKDREFIQTHMDELGVPVVAYIPYDEAVTDADMAGTPVIDYDPDSKAVRAVDELKRYLVERYKP
jgi:CO dehydrogenase maturation factor